MSISRDVALAGAAAHDGSRNPSHESIENREESVKNDLTRRMKYVCANFSSGDFDTLVKDMTRVQLRGERVCGTRLRPC